MPLDLSRLSRGTGARSADVHQFGDLVLGFMQDQPVNFKHQLSVGGGTGITAAQVPLTINGVTGQTANLVEFKNQAGTVVAAIDVLGNIVVSGSLTATSNLTAAFAEVTNLNVDGSIVSGGISAAAVVSATGQLGVQGDGGVLTSTQSFTGVRGVGNGANTAVQAPAIGTGGGPANPLLVVDFLKVYTSAGLARWMPLFA